MELMNGQRVLVDGGEHAMREGVVYGIETDGTEASYWVLFKHGDEGRFSASELTLFHEYEPPHMTGQHCDFPECE